MDAEMLLKLMSVMKSGQNAGAARGDNADNTGNAGSNPFGGFPFGALFAGAGAAGGGQGQNANVLMTLLPFLVAGGAKGGAQGETTAGANNSFSNMLPLLLSVMSGGANPFGGAGAFGGGNTCANASRNNDEARDDGRSRERGDFAYGALEYDDGAYDGEYGGRRSRHGYGTDTYARSACATRAPYGAPFDDIGFAGAEVRGFMEKLWRLRRRV